jgi:hypothetical protein
LLDGVGNTIAKKKKKKQDCATENNNSQAKIKLYKEQVTNYAI